MNTDKFLVNRQNFARVEFSSSFFYNTDLRVPQRMKKQLVSGLYVNEKYINSVLALQNLSSYTAL